jgi:anionic cell wall polymer biosynthesis LytR-Cps2A-Psr (LCP) family protein
VFKPYGKDLIGYDVNSLYPFVMKNMELPVGKPTYFEGDITQFEDITNKLGFFEVEITSPEKLDHPIIQTKLKTSAGYRTVSPLGT